MGSRSRAASWAIAVVLATACGARSTLTVSGSVGGGTTASSSTGTGAGMPEAGVPDTGVPDTGAPDTGVPDAGMDAAPPCMGLAVAPGGPIALTDPTGDSILSSVSVEGSSVFVASANDNDPSPDPTWRVRVVSGDLQTIGPSQVVLSHAQSVSLSGMSVGTAFGHRGGVAWDEVNDCRFVPLAEDGSAGTPVSPMLAVKTDSCYWLYGTAGGFLAFIAPGLGLGGNPIGRITLDPTGNVLAQTPGLIVLPNAFPLARARFDDGTVLVAYQSGVTTNAQHVGETGGPLSTPTKLLPDNPQPTVFALASLGLSGLLVWAPGDASPGEIDVEPIDEDGNATGPTTLLAGSDGSTIATIDVTAVPGGALVAWAKGAPGAADTMLMQQVSHAGAAAGAPLPVPTPAFLQNLHLAPTPEGVVVAFNAELPMTLTQVFVLRLVCGG